MYAGSLKEPDFYIWPRRAQPLPSIALECAWSERRPDLNRDRDLWLTGGAPHTRVVFIVDFKPMPSGSNRVWGVVEVWRLINGQPVQEQAEIIFPAPTPASAAAAQEIVVSRQDLLGSALPTGRSGAATYSMKIDRLRNIARDHLAANGRQPA